MGIILAVAVLVLPGALFVRRGEWERGEPIEIAGVAFAGSAAFWAVSFWALAWLPVSLKAFAQVCLASSFLALVFLRAKNMRKAWSVWRSKASPAAWQVGFLVLVLLLRLSFAATRLAYSGGDMTAHAATAEEIVLANGFPQTQEPLAPISRFGEVAPGFHVLSALVSLFSGCPTYRSTIYVLCAAVAAATFALYALLRSLAIPPPAAAAGAAGALFLARNPQFFLQWGGAPSVLAAMVAFLAISDALALSERRSWGLLLRTALLSSGVLLIHVLPAVSLAWLMLPILLFWTFRGEGSWKSLAQNAVAVAAISTVFALPFLRQAPRSVSPAALAWARDWFRAETHNAVLLAGRFAPVSGREPGVWSWPFYVATYLGALATLVLVVGLARGFSRQRRAAPLAVLLLAGNLFLFAAALAEFLPGWPALYPTRIGLWLAIPLAVAFAQLAADIGRCPRRLQAALGAIFVVLFVMEGVRLSATRLGTAFYDDAKRGAGSILLVPANEAVGGAFWVTTFCRDNSTVTADDIAAFDWIRARTPRAAVFANNPGDGGALIPAAAHRKILEPHYYWFFDAREMEAWRARAGTDYVFVGSNPAPPWARRWRTELLDRDPRVELVQSCGRARVYRVEEAFRATFR